MFFSPVPQFTNLCNGALLSLSGRPLYFRIDTLLLSLSLWCFDSKASMPLFKDLLNPSVEEEKQKHKRKRLVQSPNSYFMDVKCPGCYKITTVFSHAQTVVLCVSCSMVLCQPTGGRARLTEGCSFRRKQN
ncbi:40S ribosomal protein S27-like [Acropora millepora]|uniref:40S ribosomal protein S27-like n=2 Tax=Acropora TaxID=6127 RepID=UPI001CF42FBC|nr:40S ribosomal protein S27-like [Acropora millepora]